MCQAQQFDMNLFIGGICSNLGNTSVPPDENLSKFLIAWGREEAGGTNNGGWVQTNSCTYNMWNMGGWSYNMPQGAVGQCNKLSQNSSGTFGVLCFDSIYDAVTATSNLIAQNYQALAAAIKANDGTKFGMPHGTVADIDPGINADLQTWVSGSPTGNPGYVERILAMAQGISQAHPGNATPANPITSGGAGAIDWNRVARGAIGTVMVLAGISLLMKSLTPAPVANAVKTAAKAAMFA